MYFIFFPETGKGKYYGNCSLDDDVCPPFEPKPIWHDTGYHKTINCIWTLKKQLKKIFKNHLSSNQQCPIVPALLFNFLQDLHFRSTIHLSVDCLFLLRDFLQIKSLAIVLFWHYRNSFVAIFLNTSFQMLASAAQGVMGSKKKEKKKMFAVP